LIEPVLVQLEKSGLNIHVYSQDDPNYPKNVSRLIDDTGLEVSYHKDIETVPTLVKSKNGIEKERIVGWYREEWESFTGVENLGEGLPDFRPGCGALNVEPGKVEELAIRFGSTLLNARRVELAAMEDEVETCFERGWTDGLPVVPPTEERVVRMLQATDRAADDIVAEVPPDRVSCTVEKVAINAVMAGCKPEYLPVVLTAVEAACMDEFCMHGLLATPGFPARS